MGGEKITDETIGTIIQGSPPHRRGKVADIGLPAFPHRITPAWAGKSIILRLDVKGNRDHPRMGGEKPPVAMIAAIRWGSPPHGRGKGGKLPGRVRAEGITPAWAGKRPAPRSRQSFPRDHPRMGGEKPSDCKPTSNGSGSPPHGRGKGQHPGAGRASRGITPAWAGKREHPRPPAGGREDHPRMGGEKK